MSTFKPTSSKIGVDLNTFSSTQQFALLEQTFGSNDTEFVYCYISGALNTGSGVRISQTGTCALWTATSVATGVAFGFAQKGSEGSEYGWIAVRGNPLTVYVSDTNTLNVQLYASDTSGALTTTSTSGTLNGVAVQTAEETGASLPRLAVVTWPKHGIDANGA